MLCYCLKNVGYYDFEYVYVQYKLNKIEIESIQMRPVPHPQRSSVSERISQLNNKINSLQPKQETKKKYQNIELMCEALQTQAEEFNAFVEEKLMDIRHKIGKIGKEVGKDHAAIDSIVREEIRNCNERLLLLLDQQTETSRQNSSRMLHYIQQQSTTLHTQLQTQSTARTQQGHLIEQSLQSDINQVTSMLDQIAGSCRSRIEGAERELMGRTEALVGQLRDICAMYDDGEAEFYRMLRDLVKKVKGELQEHQTKREDTETQILNLIDKMCDKSMMQGS